MTGVECIVNGLSLQPDTVDQKFTHIRWINSALGKKKKKIISSGFADLRVDVWVSQSPSFPHPSPLSGHVLEENESCGSYQFLNLAQFPSPLVSFLEIKT